jgi:hypothetical protein
LKGFENSTRRVKTTRTYPQRESFGAIGAKEEYWTHKLVEGVLTLQLV